MNRGNSLCGGVIFFVRAALEVFTAGLRSGGGEESCTFSTSP